MSRLRTFLWQVRRELWEHRVVALAPAAVGAFAATVHFLSALTISDAERQGALTDPAKAESFMQLYGAASMSVVITGLVAGALFCLEALQGERRDRSILFWKSLPVSDLTTVLAKMAVPVAVLPAVTLAVVVLQGMVMVPLQSLAWLMRGYDPADLWARLDLPFMWLAIAYALPFMALWYAPIYAWFLLVSGWAKRMTILWAAAPFVAFLIVEHTALHQWMHWALEKRLAGGILEPFTRGGKGQEWLDGPATLEPLRLYTLPGLWLGVALAALFLFAAIRLRRSRSPI